MRKIKEILRLWLVLSWSIRKISECGKEITTQLFVAVWGVSNYLKKRRFRARGDSILFRVGKQTLALPDAFFQLGLNLRECSIRMEAVVIRRIHLFLGLFLMPWMLAYALSTLRMNHSDDRKAPAFELEYERDYVVSGEVRANRILQDLQYSGSHSTRAQRDGRVVITLNRFLYERQISYDPKVQKLFVRKRPFRFSTVLERIHKRAGAGDRSFRAYSWAFTVELAAVAMILWVLTGFWMFLKIRSAWPAGFVLFLSAIVLFTVFVFVI